MDVTVGRLLQQAVEARRQGRIAEAERMLGDALKHQPGEPQALNLLGLIALDRRDFAAAHSHFLAAVQVDPKEAALWMNVASAERGLVDVEGERSALIQAIAIDQRNLMAQVRMAQLQQKQGEAQAAADSWGKVLALTAGLTDIPPALASTLEEARQFVRDHNAHFAAFIEAGVAEGLNVADTVARRRFQACLDHEFGRRSIYQNHCSGLHYPFLPADEFFDRQHFSWMAELEAQSDAIRAEFLALIERDGANVRPYVQQDAGTPENQWTALDGSLDWSAAFLWEYGVRNETVCAACPQTVAALEALPRADIPGRAPSAFFSLLKPRSRIPAHTGVTNTRAIIHLPLIVPPGCLFRVGGETRAWQEGIAFAFDDTIDHEAWNDSDHLRVVLIFDVWNPHLSLEEQKLLKQFYATADASKTKDIQVSI
ncbi:aspartyl/asparaginyl beta-hydroxylase domain-containing protein [Sphingobium sp. BYY-5]|uniref:aspartyl/asparaginyl beta-hydroxylase domain-containing protein n=1 Tax=Sphingobium sp. BYY-5 TaxID=2926400 RepID=UPI001FA78A26|nr:aspartyl/asparaginyl beta-hydroxylase domain-containing protein [Sphingobium sp. BYY-5]MCI4590922.1 aspartyl/asparaginyl beta-hydroxylase domain-containing protein [Sphingobium sp. BYY-5]